MLGDVLLISENHKKAAKQIIQRINQLKQREKFIIAIGGESGSGKSEIAHMTSKLLKNEGIYTKILHTDNYYKIHPRERTEWRKKHGIKSIGYTELDWDLISQNIKEFRENRISTLPSVDLLTDQVDKLITDFNGIKGLILDGLYCLKAQEADLKILIDLTYHETKKAQELRGKEPQNEYRLEVLKREHEVVQSLRSKAELLITKDFDVIVP